MSGRFLLDTNILIALFADDAQVKNNLATTDEVYLSSIAVGELFYGAHKSERFSQNLARIDELVASNVVLPCNTETARRYGEIKNELRRKGRPLPENDIWIAATAFQYGLTLATRDGHFAVIEQLTTSFW